MMMMTTTTDDKIAAVAYGFDDYIAELSQTHKIDILSLTSIMLARLVMANDYAGCGPEFRKLLTQVVDIKPHDPTHDIH